MTAEPGTYTLTELMTDRSPGSLWQAYQDYVQEFRIDWYKTHEEEPSKQDFRAWARVQLLNEIYKGSC